MGQAFIKREYDYAIRICAYLAGKPKQKTIPVSQLSKSLYITRPFASKIVNQLRLKGITASRQGKYGGVFLNKNPKQLSVLDILKAMNFSESINECIQSPSVCPFTGICSIRTYFNEQEMLLLKNFNDKKISDFAFNKDGISFNKEPSQ